MAEPLKFIYGTEAQILALTPSNMDWIDRAFYYPDDKDYFYQVLNGVMKKYGSGESATIGIRLNGKNIGGVKRLIESNELLEIPENWCYDVLHLAVDGIIDCMGEINVSN